MWQNPGEIPGDGIDNDNNGYIDDVYGWDFGDDDNDPMDDDAGWLGHGTHVAGTVGAVGDNNLGVAGVNWNTSIMALKLPGSVSGAVGSVNYVTMMNQYCSLK
jgi:subtilisin family serine protease